MTANVTPILVGGSYLEPAAYELMTRLLTQLHLLELRDVVEALRATVFSHGGVLVRDRVADPRARVVAMPSTWRLTPDGVGLVEALIAVAEADGAPPAVVRAAVFDTMRMWGFEVHQA